ncbi:MAG: GNAT family N-acetyltransferase [Rhodobacteraceae bacterium]|nr:MAG: GNAT family N-acetyltransferase [Paracoccaceae bacterium]
MSLPGPEALVAALDATWPAQKVEERDGWYLRDGAGGGKRVSAVSPVGAGGDIALVEDWMRALGQRPLFRLGPDDAALDAALEERGYRVLDPTMIMVASVGLLAKKPPHVSLFDIWPPLAIMRDIWAEGGITAPRLAVMERASEPKSSLIARIDDRAAGVGFVALHGSIAMLHAVEVAPGARRKGVGGIMLRGAAYWAQMQGAGFLALAVTEANASARALYEGAGMEIVTRYHYREEKT